MEKDSNLRKLFEIVPAMVCVAGTDGYFKYLNPDWKKVLGYSLKELLSRPLFDFKHPDDHKPTRREIDRQLKGNTTLNFENRYRCKDGSYKILEWRATPAEGDKLFAVAIDLTDRKRTEASLRRSQKMSKRTESITNIGSWEWEISTDKVTWSDGLFHIFQIDPKGKAPAWSEHHELYHPEDFENLRQVVENAVVNGKPYEMEAIGTLAGGIAHEFNNIMGIIMGNTELAIDDVPDWNPAAECLQEIRTASLRAKDVVRKILSFARKSPAGRKPVPICATIKESLRLLRATIPATIDIRQEIACESEMILADQTDIHQIFINLCTNSAHAMREKPGLFEIRLESVRLERHTAARYEGLTSGDHARLMIKDTGAGIDPEIMERILDPYFTTKAVDEGLGMGLAIVYGIVKKNDGAIRIESEVGRGTRVEVLFPLTAASVGPEVPESDTLPPGSERILVVDDETSLVKMLTRMLERLGYEVVGTASGTEALTLFQAEPERYDLVITDMAMPQISGDDLAGKILCIRPDIPIILCTGHSDRIDKKRAEELGIAGFYMKPFDKKTLATEVRKVLDETKS